MEVGLTDYSSSRARLRAFSQWSLWLAWRWPTQSSEEPQRVRPPRALAPPSSETYGASNRILVIGPGRPRTANAGGSIGSMPVEECGTPVARGTATGRRNRGRRLVPAGVWANQDHPCSWPSRDGRLSLSGRLPLGPVCLSRAEADPSRNTGGSVKLSSVEPVDAGFGTPGAPISIDVGVDSRRDRLPGDPGDPAGWGRESG